MHNTHIKIYSMSQVIEILMDQIHTICEELIMSMLAKMQETKHHQKLLIKVIISTLENDMILPGKFEKCI